MRTHTVIDSPLGPLTLVATGGVLRGVHFETPRTAGESASHGFEAAIEQFEEYFAGERTSFDLPIQAGGNGLQRRVWQGLATIPYGETRSYAELATQVGLGHVVRAVGAANGQNPLPIVIPCHRVIGSDGSLTGYSGGLRRKRLLLDLETPEERLF
jgi:methylated-DNA-[protein]-cysteine S-methyltransferase